MIIGIECVPPPAVRKRDKSLPLITMPLVTRFTKRQGVRRTIALPQHVTLGRTKIAASSKPTLSMQSPESVTLGKITPITKNIPLMHIGQSVELATPGHNPIVEADFINAVFKLNGNTSVISQVITDQSPSVLTPNGALIQNGRTPVDMAGALATQMLGFNWTLILEVQIQFVEFYSGYQSRVVFFNVGTDNAEPPFLYTNAAYGEMEAEYFCQDENNDVGPTGGPGGGSGTGIIRFAEDFDNARADGIHKIAFTRNDNHVSICVDGNAAASATAPEGPFSMNPGTPQYNMFGGFQGGVIGNTSWYLRSLVVYDSLNDSLLPALTDPSTFGGGAAGKLINYVDNNNFGSSAPDTATGTSLTLSLPGSRDIGYLAIAVTTIASGKAPSWPSGWTALGGGFAAWRVLDGTESTGPTVTWTGSSTEKGWMLMYKGGSSSPVGATNTAQAESGTTASVTGITTTADQSLVVGIVVNDNGATISTSSGFIKTAEAQRAFTSFYVREQHAWIASSGGSSGNLSCTWSGSARWRAALIEIKGA